MPKIFVSPIQTNPDSSNLINSQVAANRIRGKVSRAHEGADFAVPTGTPISAIGDGRVIYSKLHISNNGPSHSYGNFIVVRHPATGLDSDGKVYYSKYAHLSTRDAQAGDTVKAGQVIGKSGGTAGLLESGNSEGPHLHMELRIKDKNPDKDEPFYGTVIENPNDYINYKQFSLKQQVEKLDGQYELEFRGNLGSDYISALGDQLFINDESLSGNALPLTNKNTNEIVPNIWKLTTNTYKREYILTRLDQNNKISSNGTKLLINPLGATNTENCIIINNFPFSESIKSAEEATKNNGVSTTVAPFGIKLSKNNQIDFSKIEFNKFSKSVGDISASVVNDYVPSSEIFRNSKVLVGGNVIHSQDSPYSNGGMKIDLWTFHPVSVKLIVLKNGNLVCCWSETMEADRREFSDPNNPNVKDYKDYVDSFINKIGYQILSPDGKTKIGDTKEIIMNSGTFVDLLQKDFWQTQTEFNILPLPNNRFALSLTEIRFGSSADKTENKVLKNNVYICDERGDIVVNKSIPESNYLYNENIGLSPDGNNLIIRWIETNNKSTKYQILDSNGNEVTQNNTSIDPTQLPTIKLINTKSIDNNTKQIGAIEGDNNIFQITENNISTSIKNFNHHNDYLDSSPLINSTENARRMLQAKESQIEEKKFLKNNNNNQESERLLQSTDSINPLQLTYEQDGADTIIRMADFNVNITLQNFKTENLSKNNFITDEGIGQNINLQFFNQTNTIPNNNTTTNTTTIPTPIAQAQITGTNQTLSFDQMASSIPFNDITITAINPNDKFEVKLVLNDQSGLAIKGAKITQGETEDNKYRSNYDEKTGIWQIVKDFDPYDDKHITGTKAQVTAEVANELLKGNAIHTDINFKPQNLIITPIITDITNNKIYNSNQIHGNYQCLEIPDDLVSKMIADQKSLTNQTLIINFLNYLKDPRDRRFIDAEFKLMQAIKNDTMDPISNDSLLQIRKLNETAFEINGNKPGNYTMDFSLEQCNKVLDRHFNLEMIGNDNSAINITNSTNTNANSNNNSNLPTIIGAGVGAALLLTTIGVAIWQRDKIKECFNYLTGRNQANDNQVVNSTTNHQINSNNKEIKAEESDKINNQQEKIEIEINEIKKEENKIVLKQDKHNYSTIIERKNLNNDVMNLTGDNKNKVNNSMSLPKASLKVNKGGVRALKEKSNEKEV